MCGIAGYVNRGKREESGGRLARMSASIAHRGPDDEGFLLVDAYTGQHMDLAGTDSGGHFKAALPMIEEVRFPNDIGLAQRRYSIIDLSPGGHQPMWSECRNACLTFNGEVYNYVELREELIAAGRRFHTSSDTEVLLQGYLTWGVDVFQKVNGFFAVALYDARKASVLLARDRLGKAQFYLSRKPDGSVYWASEIKALLAGGCIERGGINAASVSEFLIFGHRDRAGTFWSEVEDFPPGHFAWVGKEKDFSSQRYWQLPASRLNESDVSREDAARGLRDILSDALRIRMRADVPIAFELSGGMDSSALVGLAAGFLGADLTSYTIKFDEAHADEEPYARAVAARYPGKVDFRVIRQDSGNFWEEADRFVWQQEEPFHAPNLQTNQYLRRKMKADGAHVVITGSAGDEMLAGYAGDYLLPYLRHLAGRGNWARFKRELVTNTELPPLRIIRNLIGGTLLSEEAGRRLAMWRRGESRMLKDIVPRAYANANIVHLDASSERTFHGMMLANLTYRKMNYWLRSGTKANYGIPIESRSPFLDYRVVEYCCRLPPEYLIEQGWHKHVLRLAVQDLLPNEVVWRKQKMGFPFPYREWLAASRNVVEKNAEGLDCPYLSISAMMGHYEQMIKVAPVTLWRMVSVMLWWRRVVEEKRIIAQ